MTEAAAPRLTRLRRGIYAAVIVNVLLAIGLGVAVHLSRPAVFARFDRGFPVDFLVVHNRGSFTLNQVRLELDGRYVYEIDALEPGVRTFEIRRLFEDEREERPPRRYVPKQLRVVHDGGEETTPVTSGEEPP